MKQTVKNIFFLGVKELRGLGRDWMLLILIVYAFSLGVYITGVSSNDTITHAAIAVVDEDRSLASQRIVDAFMPPMFIPAADITLDEIDPGMDDGKYTFSPAGARPVNDPVLLTASGALQHVRGNAEYGDFRCIRCADWSRLALPKFKAASARESA